MDFTLIGLSIRDKRIYEALIQQPGSSIRHTAEHTGINRGSVYESIKALRTAGLVTEITIGKRTTYRAKDPEILHEIIAERCHELRIADSNINDYVQSLRAHANDPALFHFASFYQDDEGLAAILRDVLKTCRRSNILDYRVISSPKVNTYLYNNFPHFTAERVRQRLQVRVLRQGNTISEKADYAESRFFGSVPYDTGCYTLIYGKKVALIMLNETNQTSGIIIDNEHFADMQRRLFDSAWHTYS